MTRVYLDDLREPKGQYDIILRSYDAFVEYVKSVGEKIGDHYISFDHDLGEEMSGYDCAKFLINWCLDNEYDVPDYNIHSANPVGTENIESLFKTYKKVCGGSFSPEW